MAVQTGSFAGGLNYFKFINDFLALILMVSVVFGVVCVRVSVCVFKPDKN